MNERPMPWVEALPACGYPGALPIRVLGRHGVFRWHDLVLKIARHPDECAKLHVEAVANEAFQDLAGEGMRLPRCRYLERGGFGILEAEDLGGVPYAETVVGGPVREIPASAYVASIAFIQNLRSVPAEKAPPLLLEQARGSLNDAVLRARFEGYLANAVTKGVLPEPLAAALKHTYEQLPLERGLNHHDIAPWNWLDLEDGSLGQIDPEFARWGFRNYDVVYFPTQWAVSAAYPEQVSRWWEAFAQAGEDPGMLIQASLKPLTYRLAAIASDMAQAEDVRSRVRAATEAIVRHDASALGASLGLRAGKA